MKKLLVLTTLLACAAAFADPVVLTFPGNAALTFDVPEMTKVKEETVGTFFQYVATTAGKADQRFNLSIYAEPQECLYGKKLKDVTKCFVQVNARNPAIVKDSEKVSCTEKFCAVSYRTSNKVGDREISLAHTNIIMVYGEQWVDVHFSITKPTPADAAVMASFVKSLKLETNAN